MPYEKIIVGNELVKCWYTKQREAWLQIISSVSYGEWTYIAVATYSNRNVQAVIIPYVPQTGQHCTVL